MTDKEVRYLILVGVKLDLLPSCLGILDLWGAWAMTVESMMSVAGNQQPRAKPCVAVLRRTVLALTFVSTLLAETIPVDVFACETKSWTR